MQSSQSTSSALLGICWLSHVVGYPQKPEVPQGKGSSTTQWKSLGLGRGLQAMVGVLKT